MKKTLIVLIIFGMLFSYNISFGLDIRQYLDEDGNTHLPDKGYDIIEERPNIPKSVLGKRPLDWVEYGRTNDESVYLYNKKNITKSGEMNIVKVWDKIIYSPKGRLNRVKEMRRIGLSTYDWNGLSHNITLYKIDCENKKFQILSSTDYDKNGLVIFSPNSEDSQWRYIVPGSIIEILQDIVCR